MEEKKGSNRMFYTANDVAGLLGISRGHAYKLIRRLNEELEKNGYITISGRIPKKYLQERCYADFV